MFLLLDIFACNKGYQRPSSQANHFLLTWLPRHPATGKLHLSPQRHLPTCLHAIRTSTEGGPAEREGRNGKENLLVIGAMGNLLDEVDVTMLRALSAGVL